jgi:hypothetical protein
MKGFFHYELKDAISQGGDESFLSFLFKPTGYMSSEILAEGIQFAGVVAPFPDLIIIQCASKEYSELLGVSQEPNTKQALRRISSRSKVYLISYDKNGKLEDISQVGVEEESSNEKEALKNYLVTNHQKVLSTGLTKLFSEKGVIQIAPSGFTFVKPSGDRSRIFLKTEEALSSSERVQFVAFSLLPKLAIRNKNLCIPIDSIFVDTMGIASIAYALRDLYWGDGLEQQHIPRIESFHSHSGLKDFEPPLNGTTFCLISASQSMRLQSLWKQKTRTNDDEVVTLLTIMGAENAELALYAVNITDEGEKFSKTNALHDIRIVGERFYPDQIKPREVLLKQKFHNVLKFYEIAKQWHTRDIFKLQVRDRTTVRPIYLDISHILDEQEGPFAEWVEKICNQYIPLSLQAVVAQNDDQSIELASKIIEKLKGAYNVNLIDDKPINELKISDGTLSLDKNRALLIVAAVIGKGTRLLSISRDLRDKHEGARCYVIGFQIAECQAQILTLNQNLKSPASKSRWIIETYNSLALGKGQGHSFESELEVSIRNEIADKRLGKIAGSPEGLLSDAFWPSAENLSPLELRKDFAYWPEIEYEPSGRYAPWVFAMVSALLQKAREDVSLPIECQLSTEAYQNVILNPENFLRYNDGLIQSAILRAAHPHELDYSCSGEISLTVKNILLKIFENLTTCQSEAAFEFAMALRTERLKLQGDHYEELLETLKHKLSVTCDKSMILRTILGIEIGGVQAAEEL